MKNLIDISVIKNLIFTFINSQNSEFSRYFLNYKTGLLDLIDSRLSFNKEWYQKNSLYFTPSYKINFEKIHFSHNNAFVFLKITTIYDIDTFNNSSIDSNNICFILSELSKHNWIIDFIVSSEASPTLYDEIYNDTFSYNSLFQHNTTSIYHYKTLLSNINDFKLNHSNINLKSINLKRNFRIFNKEKTIEYAQKYALDYNKDFKSFDKSGGDCTNFVSQSIWYGGIKQTKTWKPYTNPWLRVIELRNYLIYNYLAKEYTSINKNSIGSIVQFYHKEKKTWTHSGIITYLINNEALYCCHSYDKLNFPLNIVYPSIYPKIRIITPY